jgi:hypothetical protein
MRDNHFNLAVSVVRPVQRHVGPGQSSHPVSGSGLSVQGAADAKAQMRRTIIAALIGCVFAACIARLIGLALCDRHHRRRRDRRVMLTDVRSFMTAARLFL